MKIVNKMFEYSWKYVPSLMIVTLLFTDFAFADKQQQFINSWRGLMKEYNVIISSVIGLGLLTSILIFIIHMIQLATLGNAHAMIRKGIIHNVLISGICTALLGGIGLIYTIIYTSVF